MFTQVEQLGEFEALQVVEICIRVFSLRCFALGCSGKRCTSVAAASRENILWKYSTPVHQRCLSASKRITISFEPFLILLVLFFCSYLGLNFIEFFFEVLFSMSIMSKQSYYFNEELITQKEGRASGTTRLQKWLLGSCVHRHFNSVFILQQVAIRILGKMNYKNYGNFDYCKSLYF